MDKNETGVHGYIKGECTPQGTRIAFVPYAVREYKKIKIQLHEKTTQYSLEHTLAKAVEERGRQHIYSVFLEGEKSLDMEFFEDNLYKIGNIREVEDRTRPAYAIEMLKTKYEGSVLAEYIRGFNEEGRSEEEEKALCYGIEALLLSGEEML